MAYHKNKTILVSPECINLRKYKVIESFTLLQYFIEINSRFELLFDTNYHEKMEKEVDICKYLKKNKLNLSRDRFNDFYKEPIFYYRDINNSLPEHSLTMTLLRVFNSYKSKNQFRSLGLMTYERTWEAVKMLDNHLNGMEHLNEDEKKLFKLRKKIFKLNWKTNNNETKIKKFTSKIKKLLGKGTVDYFKMNVHDINYYELQLNHTSLIEINPDAPISTLKKDFERLVRNIKTKNERTLNLNLITEQRLKKYKKYRLIEYFDLMIYFNVNEIEFNDIQVAELIFPESEEEGGYKSPEHTLVAHTKKFLNEIIKYKWRTHLFNQLYTNPELMKDTLE